MKKVKYYILNNWLLLTIGFILTALSVQCAYKERGYLAFGGEWFTLPLLLLIKILYESIKEEVLTLVRDYE